MYLHDISIICKESNLHFYLRSTEVGSRLWRLLHALRMVLGPSKHRTTAGQLFWPLT